MANGNVTMEMSVFQRIGFAIVMMTAMMGLMRLIAKTVTLSLSKRLLDNF